MAEVMDTCSICVPRSDLACPICRDTISDVYSTPCGHSFCYSCILQSLEHRPLCPCCSSYVTKEKLYPNALLSKLIRRVEQVDKLQQASVMDRLKHVVASNGVALSVPDITELEEILQETKTRLEMDDMQTQMLMLKQFLACSRDKKMRKVEDLRRMLGSLRMDIQAVESQRGRMWGLCQQVEARAASERPAGGGECEESKLAASDSNSVAGTEVSTSGRQEKKERVFSQFEELAGCYMKLRRKEMEGLGEPSRDINTAALLGQPADAAQSSALEEFARMLSVYTHQNKLELLSEVPLNSGMLSSIEFNRDGSVFATAGISKCIRIMNSEAIKMGGPDAGRSRCEMVTRAKPSSLSWNKFIENQLVSSDNEGVLTLWDSSTGQIVQDYEAHEKRIWSVDFCPTDPLLIASGSDDGKVKIWSTNQNGAVLQLDLRVNVCSVCYSTSSANTIAVGSADHLVRLFDLRNPATPVNTLQGHSKAVSYVSILSETEVVSASIDSSLRLWNLASSSQTRVFSSHKNLRNFVGMSVSKDFIACGSETAEVFVYYKALSPALVVQPFPDATPQEFTSAVSWQPNSSVLFAASSLGRMMALQLTGSND
mmetsp:Transcript_12120/g.34092  ORF Transcript_12120/g.34092 Transcript_12120/m.34092 type:complete len:599 (-) Transcript_12120:191-1987(-)